MRIIKSFRPLAAFMLSASLLGGCTQRNETAELVDAPSELESTISIAQGKYKPISDQIKSLEDSLQTFSQAAERISILGEDYGDYEIKNNEFGAVKDLQSELRETHIALLAFLADPSLNPNGRFAAQTVEIAGSIGDTEKSMAGIYDEGGDFLDWKADSGIMEDCRRLHHELQALRADISGVANKPGLSEQPAPKM